MARIEHWLDLTGPEIGRLAQKGPVALLSVAAVEQHGPHLPVATDVVIGEGIVQASISALASSEDDFDLLLLPALTLGNSSEHTNFSGTLSLSAEQMIAQICAVGAGVARAGIRKLVIFNSHGGNKAAIDIAALRMRTERGLFVVKTHSFRFAVPENTLSADELASGLHGGALETSMMLHLAPESVRREALADFESLDDARARAGATLRAEGDAGFAWMAEDLHPQGVTGQAAIADAAMGARLVAAFGQRLAEVVAETAGFAWPPGHKGEHDPARQE